MARRRATPAPAAAPPARCAMLRTEMRSNGSVHLLGRLISVVVLDALLLLLLAAILPGFSADSFWAALGLAIALGLANALIWPLLVRVALPFTVATLGLGALLLNGLVLLGIAEVDK